MNVPRAMLSTRRAATGVASQVSRTRGYIGGGRYRNAAFYSTRLTRTAHQDHTRSERRWQIGAVTFLSLSALLLFNTQVHSDDLEKPAKKQKKGNSEKLHDDPYDKADHPDGPESMPHPNATEGLRMISASELSDHNTEAAGYWIAIEGTVWDVTEFITSGAHPGGSKILISHCGKDGTGAFKPIHPPGG